MLKYIINNPVISAVLFILMFQYIFQYHITIYIYIMLLYVALKILGVTKYIKKYINMIYKKISNLAKEIIQDYCLKKVIHPINITTRNSDGNIEGFYMISKKYQWYYVSVKKNTKEVHIRIWRLSSQNEKSKPTEMTTTPFYINLENVTNYIEKYNLI